MIIGDRIRSLREEKNLSQGDIQSRTGLLRCYVSRVENGHTIPSIETLEKIAQALGTPLYRLFYDGVDVPPPLALNLRKTHEALWGDEDEDMRDFRRIRKLLGQMNESDRKLLLHIAKIMGNH
jgi:transcriptional regulator with XRE-family HTH domain